METRGQMTTTMMRRGCTTVDVPTDTLHQTLTPTLPQNALARQVSALLTMHMVIRPSAARQAPSMDLQTLRLTSAQCPLLLRPPLRLFRLRSRLLAQSPSLLLHLRLLLPMHRLLLLLIRHYTLHRINLTCHLVRHRLSTQLPRCLMFLSQPLPRQTYILLGRRYPTEETHQQARSMSTLTRTRIHVFKQSARKATRNHQPHPCLRYAFQTLSACNLAKPTILSKPLEFLDPKLLPTWSHLYLPFKHSQSFHQLHLSQRAVLGLVQEMTMDPSRAFGKRTRHCRNGRTRRPSGMTNDHFTMACGLIVKPILVGCSVVLHTTEFLRSWAVPTRWPISGPMGAWFLRFLLPCIKQNKSAFIHYTTGGPLNGMAYRRKCRPLTVNILGLATRPLGFFLHFRFLFPWLQAYFYTYFHLSTAVYDSVRLFFLTLFSLYSPELCHPSD